MSEDIEIELTDEEWEFVKAHGKFLVPIGDLRLMECEVCTDDDGTEYIQAGLYKGVDDGDA